MSKITQAKKAKKAKQTTETVEAVTPEVQKPNIPNFGKCCSCKKFTNNPGFCHVKKEYRARKAAACETDYKY